MSRGVDPHAVLLEHALQRNVADALGKGAHADHVILAAVVFPLVFPRQVDAERQFRTQVGIALLVRVGGAVAVVDRVAARHELGDLRRLVGAADGKAELVAMIVFPARLEQGLQDRAPDAGRDVHRQVRIALAGRAQAFAAQADVGRPGIAQVPLVLDPERGAAHRGLVGLVAVQQRLAECVRLVLAPGFLAPLASEFPPQRQRVRLE